MLGCRMKRCEGVTLPKKRTVGVRWGEEEETEGIQETNQRRREF